VRPGEEGIGFKEGERLKVEGERRKDREF